MNGTTVIYNGVRLINVNTRQMEQDVVLDPSGTDVVGQRVVMSFDTTCHVQHLEAMVHGVDGYSLGFGAGTTADLFTRAKIALSQPRCQLSVYVDNNLLWEVFPATPASVQAVSNFDTNNGPHPKRVLVRQIVGSEIVSISFTIEFTLGQCAGGGTPFVIVSNKWSVAEERDGNFFTTRRITGQLRTSHSGFAGHSMLPWCVPGLEYGFRREVIAYDAGANGLDCSYQIVDRQTHTAAPYPATDVSGTYSWSTSLETGNWVHHSEFTLTGSPDADVKRLVARAVELCDARVKYLSNNNPLAGPRPMLMNECSITEHVGSGNSVRAQMTVTMYPATPTMMIANIVDDQIGAPITLSPAGQGAQAIPYDVGISRVPATWGYTPRKDGARSPVTLFLLHCYQQTPCSPVKGMYQWTNGADIPASPNTPSQYPDDLTQVSPGTISPGDMSNFDDQEQKAGIYTYVRMSSTYRTHNRRAQLSIAGDWAADDGQSSCVVVKTGRPLTRRLVRYEAERQDKPPKLPQISDDLTLGGIKHTLLDYEIEVCAPKTTADGLHWIYRVEAWYLFALARPLKTTDKIALGVLPVANANDAQTLDLNASGTANLYGKQS